MGSSGSSNTSRPLTADERLDSYNAGMGAIKPEYAYYEKPTMQTLSDQDYNKLEQSIVDSRTAPLDRAWQLERDSINQEMADRGLWSSGVPAQAMQKRYEDAYIPQFKAAGAEAATQRYGMQANELAQINQANLDTASKEYESKFRPLDYQAGLWNNTSGVISSGSSGGWSI